MVAEAEAPIFGLLMPRSISLGKTPMLERLKAGEERAVEDEMVGWYH